MIVWFDLEWGIETRTFRCASWYTEGKLYGTHSFTVFKDFIEGLPDDVTLGGFNILSDSDLRRCLEWGIALPANFRVQDAFIATKLLHPTYPWKDLKSVSRLHGFQYENEATTDATVRLLDYCGKDTVAAQVVYEAAAAEAQARVPALSPALEVYNDIAQAFFLVEVAGMKVDHQFLTREQLRLTSELGRLTPQLPDPAMVTNTNVLRDWVEQRWTPKELAILPRAVDPVTGERSGPRSMDVSYLTLLPRQTKQFQAILDARATYSYYNLFVRRPLEEFGDFFHPRYKLLHASTGRRSTEPAIQNWPAESRQAFKSRYQDGKIVSVDFRNLEARLFAWEAGCTKLLTALIEGGYPLIASQTFGGPLIEKSDPKYKVIKATVLAVLYNMTPWLYGHNVWVSSGGKIKMSTEETERTLQQFFDTYPEIYEERERRKAYVWEHGAALSTAGAPIELLVLPEDLYLDNPKWVKDYRKRIENQAVNNPTQQLAGYVTGCGLVDVITALQQQQWGTFADLLWQARASCGWVPKPQGQVLPISEVHDELVFDVPYEDVPDSKQLLVECLVNNHTTLKRVVPQFDCPLDVEIVVGDYWKKD